MNPKRSTLVTRRQAILSITAISAGALLKPSSVFCSPVNDKLRFAVVGDWGTGDRDEAKTADRMFAHHQVAPCDFDISAGDNVYPHGSGRHFSRNFEQPFAPFLKDRIKF